MIKSFRHKGLKELFETGSARKMKSDLQARAIRRLDVLDNAESLSELNIEWEEGHAWRVDLEQYH